MPTFSADDIDEPLAAPAAPAPKGRFSAADVEVSAPPVNGAGHGRFSAADVAPAQTAPVAPPKNGSSASWLSPNPNDQAQAAEDAITKGGQLRQGQLNLSGYSSAFAAPPPPTPAPQAAPPKTPVPTSVDLSSYQSAFAQPPVPGMEQLGGVPPGPPEAPVTRLTREAMTGHFAASTPAAIQAVREAEQPTPWGPVPDELRPRGIDAALQEAGRFLPQQGDLGPILGGLTQAGLGGIQLGKSLAPAALPAARMALGLPPGAIPPVDLKGATAGASNLIEGGFETASPLGAAGFAEAPVATLKAFGTLMGVAKGTEWAALQSGASPETARLAGDLVSIPAAFGGFRYVLGAADAKLEAHNRVTESMLQQEQLRGVGGQGATLPIRNIFVGETHPVIVDGQLATAEFADGNLTITRQSDGRVLGAGLDAAQRLGAVAVPNGMSPEAALERLLIQRYYNAAAQHTEAQGDLEEARATGDQDAFNFSRGRLSEAQQEIQRIGERLAALDRAKSGARSAAPGQPVPQRVPPPPQPQETVDQYADRVVRADTGTPLRPGAMTPEPRGLSYSETMALQPAGTAPDGTPLFSYTGPDGNVLFKGTAQQMAGWMEAHPGAYETKTPGARPPGPEDTDSVIAELNRRAAMRNRPPGAPPSPEELAARNLLAQSNAATRAQMNRFAGLSEPPEPPAAPQPFDTSARGLRAAGFDPYAEPTPEAKLDILSRARDAEATRVQWFTEHGQPELAARAEAARALYAREIGALPGVPAQPAAAPSAPSPETGLPPITTPAEGGIIAPAPPVVPVESAPPGGTITPSSPGVLPPFTIPPPVPGEPQTVPQTPQSVGSPQIAEAQPAPGEPGWAGRIPTSLIHTDPARFQFKANVGQGGAGDELRNINKWDPVKGGVGLVWKDPADGLTYAVNMHNRLALAQRVGAPEVLVQYSDAPTAREAMLQGAYANIAENRGDPLDAARIFRETGLTPEQIEQQEGISLRGKLASQGLALSRLAPRLFHDVAAGDLSVERGTVIGAGVPEADQENFYDLLEKREAAGKRLTNDQVGELIRLNRNVPVVTRPKDEGGQTNLWGEQEIEQALLPEKAEVSDYIRKQLAGEKRLFGAVSTDAAAQTLTQGGNVIQTQANQQRAQQANQGIVLYDKLSERTGPIDDILNQAAQSLAGEPNAAAQAKIKRDAHAAVRDHLAAQLSVLTGGAPSGAPVHPPHDAGGTPATGAGQPSAPAAQPEVSQPQSAQGETPAVAPEAPSVSPGPAPSGAPQTPSVPGAEEPHDFSSTQANLSGPVADSVRAAGAEIPDNQLAKDGRETAPHVTVKYGLHSEDPAEVHKLLKDEPPITATLGKASIFHTDDADVLKVDVHSPDLHRLNAKISDALPHTDTHPTYQPHVTIAYLKPGQGAQYDGREIPGVTGQQITLPSVAFSSKNGEQTEIQLGGKTPATATPPTEANPKTPPENIPVPQPAGVEPKTPSAAGAAGLDPNDIIANLKKKLAEKQQQAAPAPAPAPATREEAIKQFQVGDQVTFPNFGATITGTVMKILPGGVVSKIPGQPPSQPTLQVRIDKEEGLAPGKKGATIGGLTGVNPLNAKKVEPPLPSPGPPIGGKKGTAAARKGGREALQRAQDEGHDARILRDHSGQPLETKQAGTIPAPLSQVYLRTLRVPPNRSPEAAQKLVGGFYESYGDGIDQITGVDVSKGYPSYTVRDANTGEVRTHGTFIDPRGVTFAPVPAYQQGGNNPRGEAAGGAEGALPAIPPRNSNPFASGADAARQRARDRMRRAKGELPSSLQSRALTPDEAAEYKQNFTDLAEIGLDHAANGAKTYNEWQQRVMADVGDVVNWVAESAGMTPDDVLREVYGYVAQAVAGTQYEVEAAPEKPQVIPEVPASNPPPVNPEAPVSAKPGGMPALVHAVYEKLKAGESLGNAPEFFKLAEQHFGSSRTSGQWTPKDMFDAMETGVNQYLLERGADLLAMPYEQAMQELRGLMDRLPSQASVRTQEQIDQQQFSTPPTESYTVARVANLVPTDAVLEPSAGNGGLAIWPKAIGATVHTNELNERRRGNLDALGLGPATGHDAEIIHATLDEAVKPTAVLMNPPFSVSSTGAAAHRTQFGLNHVDQALQRLRPGGRLVVILGGGHANDANGGASLNTGPSGKWFDRIAQLYHVRANVRVSGKEYQKYGTTFATRIIVIDKDGPTPSQVTKGQPKSWDSVVQGNAETLEEAYNLLRDVANSRPQIETGTANDSGLGRPQSGTGIPVLQGESQPGPGGQPAGVPGSGGAPGTAGQPGRLPAGSGSPELRPGGGAQLPGGVQPGSPVAPDSGVGAPGGNQGVAGHAPTESPAAGQALPLERADTPSEPLPPEPDDQNPYVPYRPTLAGPAHPGDIVETRAMSTVPLPAITYRPNLPPELLTNGNLSAVQLEAVALAGQQNNIVLPGGAYSTSLVGDGTGLGKGREAAAILLDNWRQGRRRLLWVSEKWDLMQDAVRDLRGIGAEDLLRGVRPAANGKNTLMPDSRVKPLNKFGYGDDINHEGMLFSTYGSVRAENKKGARRVDQIEKWLRGNDDGEGAYIVFDESHNLKHSTGAGASDTGAKVRELLQRMPHLRVVSLSATAATDVGNLGYLDRLGLWGPGTAFPQGFEEFQGEMAPGGLAAMEMIARNLKAQGKYLARTLSYAGVNYDVRKHELTPEQKELYRTAASAWRTVIDHAENTMANITNAGRQAHRGFASALGGAQQRFFAVLITALKAPSCIEEATAALARGESVAISLENTNEAQQNRVKARTPQRDEDSDEPEDFDLGPADILVNLIQEHYPIQQYQDKVAPDGTVTREPVWTRDAKGNRIPVINPAARAARDALVAQVKRDLHMPDNPLDSIINALGGQAAVAEITGRKEFVDRSTGKFVKRGDPTTPRDQVNLLEAKAFQDGKKRVALISRAGGTGISLHAGNDVANRQKRFHIILQTGWQADKTLQGMGRTHRSNQAQPPEYKFLVSDLAGEQRFVSTITRRIGSMGAISRGQGNAIGWMGNDANIESEQGEQAASGFYAGLLRDIPVPGTDLTGMQILTDMRMLKFDPTQGLTVPQPDRTDVPKLMNRLLALDPDVQNAVYAYYFDIFNAAVEHAIATGTLDTGVKTLPGDEFHVKESRVLSRDPKSGAETLYYPVDAKVKTNRVSPEDLDERMVKNHERNPVILRHRENGKLLLAMNAPPIVRISGQVDPAFYICAPDRGRFDKIPQAELQQKGFREVSAWAQEEAAKARQAVENEAHLVRDAEREIENFTQTGKEAMVERAERAVNQAALRLANLDKPAPPPGTVIYQGGQYRIAWGPAQTRFGFKAKLTPLNGGADKWARPDDYQAAPRPLAPAELAEAVGAETARLEAARTALEQARIATQSYQVPADHWSRVQLVNRQKDLAEKQQQLAQAEAAAQNSGPAAREMWKQAYEAAPPYQTVEHHLIGGDVFRFWNPVRTASGGLRNSVYTTADTNTHQRVVGVDIPAGQIQKLLDRITGGRSTVDARQLYNDVFTNNTRYTLEGGIQVLRGRVGRTNVIQLMPPNPDIARTLTGMGVVYEAGVQPVYYVPNRHEGPLEQQTGAILTRILSQYPVAPEPQAPAALQSRRVPLAPAPLPPQDDLFGEHEPGQTIPGTTPAKLLGEQLTAQLKSGMAARPSKLKPSTGNRGLFDEERPEQGALFARRPVPLRLVDTGQKSPSGSVVYKLHDGKIVLPYAGTEGEMRAAGAKMGRAVEAGAAPGTAQWVLDYVKQNGPVHVLDLAAHSGLSRAQFQPALLKLIGQGKVDADDFLLPGEKDRSGKVSDDYADAVAALQSRRMEGFYSQLERVVEQKMQARSSPQQLLAMLRNPQNGVKSDELAWSGLEQFLEDRKGVPVTKQEVQHFLKQNEVRVEEVQHGQTVDKERIARADAELKAAQQDVSEQQARSVDFKEGDRVATVGSAASVGGYSYSTGKVYEVQRNRAGILVWKVVGDFGGTRSGRSDKFVAELKEQAKYPWMKEVRSGDVVGLLAPQAETEQLESRRAALAQRASDIRSARSGGMFYGPHDQDDEYKRVQAELAGVLNEQSARSVPQLNLSKLQNAEDEAAAARADKTGAPTKFQKYKLPGGENYRELLLTLPPKPATDAEKRVDALRLRSRAAYDNDQTARIAALNHPDDESLRAEYVAATAEHNRLARELGTAEAALQRSVAYESPHWNEPNVAAHIRMSDYTTADGKKVAVMIEDQSDWHEAGRKKGYKPSGEALKELEQKLAEADAAHTKTADAISEAKKNFLYGPGWHGETQQEWEARTAERLDAVTKAERANGEAYTRLQALREQVNHGVPNAPFSKTWHELVFRRALRDAVERGADKFAWTTGEQQLRIYPQLSEVVSGIGWHQPTGALIVREKGAYEDPAFSPVHHTGKTIARNVTNEEDLAEHVGKDVAQRIAEAAPDEDGFRRVTGAGLRTGAQGLHGMKAFYDQMLPQYAAKYVKKWGATVGEVKLKGVTGKLHSIDITPAMRESVMQGQPLFARKNPGQEPTGLRDRGLFRLKNATAPQRSEAYWAAAESKSTTMHGTPSLLVNNAAFDVIAHNMGPSGATADSRGSDALTLEAPQLRYVLNAAQALRGQQPIGAFEKTLLTIARQIRNTNPNLLPFPVLQTGESVPDDILIVNAREEADHVIQLSLPNGLADLPVDAIKAGEGRKAANTLLRSGYVAAIPGTRYYEANLRNLAAEVGVRLMRVGRYRELNLTAEEAERLGKQFIDHLENNPSPAARAIVEATREHTQRTADQLFPGRPGNLGMAPLGRPSEMEKAHGPPEAGGSAEAPAEGRAPEPGGEGEPGPTALEKRGGALAPQALASRSLGLAKLATHEIVPTAKGATRWMSKTWDDTLKSLAPQFRGADARRGYGLLRERGSETALRQLQAEKAVEGMEKHFLAQPEEMGVHGLPVIDAMESGDTKGLTGSDLRFAQIAHKLLEEREEEIKRLDLLGHYLDNYFPHAWKDPAAAAAWVKSWQQKRPMAGSEAYRKKRTFPTMREGLEDPDFTMEPKFNTPVGFLLDKLSEMDKSITAHDVFEELNGEHYFGDEHLKGQPRPPKILQWVPAEHRLPQGLGKINDGIFKRGGPKFGAVVLPEGTNVNFPPKSTAGSEFQEGDVRVLGKREMGYYAAPIPLADLINNHLDPGLRTGTLAGAMKLINAGNRVLNMFELGFSYFHGMTTTLNSSVSDVALGMEQALAGHKIQGLRSMARGMVPFASVVNDFLVGKKLRAAIEKNDPNDPVGQAFAQVLKQAGGRATQDTYWTTAFTRSMVRAWRENEGLGALLAAGVHIPFVATEQTLRPIMQGLVPRVKLAAFSRLAENLIQQNPDMTPEQARDLFGKAWNSIDNRFGQFTQANLMMNPVAKDIMNALVGRPGWNLGTVGEMGGGAYDLAKAAVDTVRSPWTGKPPELTHRAAFVIASFLVTAALSAVLCRILSGEWPKDAHDLIAPRDGGVDEQGNPSRILLPLYLGKDVYNYATRPLPTLKAKTAPVIQVAADLLWNRNFQNFKIYGKGGMGVGGYLLNEIEPYAAQGLEQNIQRGGPLASKVLPFVGVMPAPKRMGMSAAQRFLADYQAEHMEGTRFERTERQKLESSIMQAVRTGKIERAIDLGNQGVAAGKVTEDDVGHAIERAAGSPLEAGFKRLPVEDELDLMRIATPQERDQLLAITRKDGKPYFETKVFDRLTKLPPAEQQKILDQIDAAHLQ